MYFECLSVDFHISNNRLFDFHEYPLNSQFYVNMRLQINLIDFRQLLCLPWQHFGWKCAERESSIWDALSCLSKRHRFNQEELSGGNSHVCPGYWVYIFSPFEHSYQWSVVNYVFKRQVTGIYRWFGSPFSNGLNGMTKRGESF